MYITTLLVLKNWKLQTDKFKRYQFLLQFLNANKKIYNELLNENCKTPVKFEMYGVIILNKIRIITLELEFYWIKKEIVILVSGQDILTDHIFILVFL